MISKHVYSVEKIKTKKVGKTNVDRITIYKSRMDEKLVSAELKEQIKCNRAKYELIEDYMDISETPTRVSKF